ncbi:trp operon repressor [Patescibacteria group bacterium]|nr:trp operon repressor [Patescibacteria group bacterium]
MKQRITEGNWRKDPRFRALCSAIRSCKNEEEIADLLRDVGTLSELQAWSERLEVAKQLSRGFSYRQVAANTGASTTTVTRVAKFIENGPGGYRRFLKSRSHHHHDSSPTSLSAHGATGDRRGEKTGSVLQGYLDRAQK